MHHAGVGVGLGVKILEHERTADDLKTRRLAACPHPLEAKFEVEALQQFEVARGQKAQQVECGARRGDDYLKS